MSMIIVRVKNLLLTQRTAKLVVWLQRHPSVPLAEFILLQPRVLHFSSVSFQKTQA